MYPIPVTTAVLAFVFFAVIMKDFLRRSHSTCSLWFALGLAAYGAGAFTESIHTLSGFSSLNFKLWYISGALLGGWSLVTGLLYLILDKKTADILMLVGLAYIVVISAYCCMSPVRIVPEGIHLNGSAFYWTFISPMTMVIHLYSFILLLGAALFSAFQFSKSNRFKSRFLGILLIATGSLLPGLGKSHSDMTVSSTYYLLELLGLILIFAGSYIIIHKQETTAATFQSTINL